MKEARTTKLYSGLSGQELAAVAFFHTAEQNQIEMDRVLSVVPRKNYSCLDQDFIRQQDYLFSVVTFWGSEYWRKLFMHTAALLETYHADGEQPKAWERVDTTAEALETWHAVLAAWCDKHGLDIGAAYKLAGVDPDKRVGRLTADPAQVEEWLEELASFSPYERATN